MPRVEILHRKTDLGKVIHDAMLLHEAPGACFYLARQVTPVAVFHHDIQIIVILKVLHVADNVGVLQGLQHRTLMTCLVALLLAHLHEGDLLDDEESAIDLAFDEYGTTKTTFAQDTDLGILIHVYYR